MFVVVGKQLRHAAKTEWHATSKHDMGKVDLSPILRIPGERVATLKLLAAILHESNELLETYCPQKWKYCK